MFNPLTLKIGASALAIASAFGLGWKICSWKNDSAYKDSYAALMKQLNDANVKNQQLSNTYNDLLKKDQSQSNKVDQNVKVEIQKYPVYIDCKYTDGGMQSIKSTVDQANQTKSAK
jgi:hypothetical protein